MICPKCIKNKEVYYEINSDRFRNSFRRSSIIDANKLHLLKNPNDYFHNFSDFIFKYFSIAEDEYKNVMTKYLIDFEKIKFKKEKRGLEVLKLNLNHFKL